MSAPNTCGGANEIETDTYPKTTLDVPFLIEGVGSCRMDAKKKKTDFKITYV